MNGIGIDVSKATLDVAIYQGQHRQFNNAARTADIYEPGLRSFY